MKFQILAVTNQKGGVGKTTTAINLAASLAAAKRRVLLIDMDPQGNATMGSGIDKNSVSLSAYDVLVEGVAISDAKVRQPEIEFDVLPANGDMTAAEVELLSLSQREFRLREALKYVRQDYDVVVIDCPPSLNMLTLNALAAANGVIIPMQCEYYALEGLAALMDTIEQIRDNLNPELQIEGVIRTMYDPRNSLTIDVSKELSHHFGDKLYRTVIPRNVRLAEAPSYGVPVMHYDKTSKGAMAYLAMAGEMLRRHDADDAVLAAQ